MKHLAPHANNIIFIAKYAAGVTPAAEAVQRIRDYMEHAATSRGWRRLPVVMAYAGPLHGVWTSFNDDARILCSQEIADDAEPTAVPGRCQCYLLKSDFASPVDVAILFWDRLFLAWTAASIDVIQRPSGG